FSTGTRKNDSNKTKVDLGALTTVLGTYSTLARDDTTKRICTKSLPQKQNDCILEGICFPSNTDWEMVE
ncbi:MAG: hypothetical protein VX278_07035, partial [Myxococcota bacterium]|nr:hypothetical protein [Myxococcota bacterium]